MNSSFFKLEKKTTIREGIGGNRQTCVCEALVPKDLKVRTHTCKACGLTTPRDKVSANIVLLIAFGTTSAALDKLRGPGRLFLDCGGIEVCVAKAVTTSP